MAFLLGVVTAYLIATPCCVTAKTTLHDVLISTIDAFPDGLIIVCLLVGVGGTLGQGIWIVWYRLIGTAVPGDLDSQLNTCAIYQTYIGLALGLIYWRYH